METRFTNCRVAIIHYWWLTTRGGEAVLKSLVKLFPNADMFFHVCDESLVRQELGEDFRGQIRQTFISKMPGSRQHYQRYLPLMPLALEQLDLREYDLVISSESGPAKGVITRPDAYHICYCHSPMRYLWDMYHEYTASLPFITRNAFKLFAHYLRIWDSQSADRVDQFVANSNHVRRRIMKCYRRDAAVVHPPVATNLFNPSREREDFYLYLGQLVPYKRADLAVSAFNALGKRLVVIGEGSQGKLLRTIASPNIEFLGRQPFSVVKDHLERCKALVFPGVEDFGIVPVEANASGAPVIAFRKGGATETLCEGRGGYFFDRQTVSELQGIVERFETETKRPGPELLAEHASQFNERRFRTEIGDFLASL